MRIYQLLLILLLICMPAFSVEIEVPFCKDAAASGEFAKHAQTAGRCYVADLSMAQVGTIVKGRTEANLAPGCYRARMSLALTPLGDPVTSGMTVKVAVGNNIQTLTPLVFAEPGKFIDTTINFNISDASSPPVSVSWEGVKKLKAPAVATDDPDPDAKDNVDDGELFPAVGEDKMVNFAELKGCKYYLAVQGLYIEKLSPVEVTKATVDKVIYKTSQTAKGEVTLTNYGTDPANVKLTVSLLYGLDGQRVVDTKNYTLAPKETVNWTGDFPVKDLHYGVEMKAAATVDGWSSASKSDIFAVNDNIYESAMIGAMGSGTLAPVDKEYARNKALEFRNKGFTGFETFFWAPCDMLEFTPDQEDFFGGQGGYPATVTGTKNVVAAFHDQGMVGTFYSNLWGGSGPPAFDNMRKHPEWFAHGNFNSAIISDWDLLGNSGGDMKNHHIRAPGIDWAFTQINLQPPDSLFRWHAKEIIDSQKMFGWDGIRYDSSYSRYWEIRAMRVVRGIVDNALPNFGWGYNAFATSDYKNNALDTLIHNGGMVMAEGIRLNYLGGSLASYLNELNVWRNIVWPYGGHLGPLYAPPEIPDKKETPESAKAKMIDAVYVSSVILATGSHPYYHPLESDTGKFGRFALRYGEYIWDNRMRPLVDPASVVSFGNNIDPFQWKPLVRTLNLGGNKRRLVIHLLNIDPKYQAYVNFDMKVMPPIRNLPVTLNLPAGAAVTGAWSMTPVPTPAQMAVKYQMDGGKVNLTVPEVRFYNVLMVEYTADQPLAEPLNPKSATDSNMQDWYLIGPFPSNLDFSGYDAAYPPEKGIDLTASYPGVDDKPVKWNKYRKTGDPVQSSTFIDLGESVSNAFGVCGYAYTKVISDRDRDAMIFASHDDTMTVWLNGEKVMETGKKECEIQLDQSKAAIKLKKGENTILIKCCQKWMSWGFLFRIADKDGRPLTDGMTYVFTKD
ncbi:MAG: hypothetical protein WCO98_02890 [bacterium]